MPSIVIIEVSCNSIAEARKIGRSLLKQRLVACFDVMPRIATEYFWPAKSGKIESSKGAVLTLKTVTSKIKNVNAVVTSLHSDKLPYIGWKNIQVTKSFQSWLEKEIQ